MLILRCKHSSDISLINIKHLRKVIQIEPELNLCEQKNTHNHEKLFYSRLSNISFCSYFL